MITIHGKFTNATTKQCCGTLIINKSDRKKKRPEAKKKTLQFGLIN